MRIFIIFLFSLSLSSCLSWFSKEENPEKEMVSKKEMLDLLAKTTDPSLLPPLKQDCASTKEFVTAFNFLRDQKELAIKEPDARNLASKVAGGCSGAAKRFVETANLLIKAKIDSRNTLLLATDIALSTDEKADTFALVFRKAYLSEYLDMDLHSSIKIAQDLSTKFNGSQKQVQKSFEKLVEFCVSNDKLDLPRPKCGQLAAKIASYSENYREPIADKYIEAVEYLISKDKANITLYEAMNVAADVAAISPHAINNFIKGYEYGMSKSGLNLTKKEALQFGKNMAEKTVLKETNIAH